MSIPAIGALTSATDPNALMAVTSTGLITPPAGGGTVSDSTFGQMLTNSIDNLQGLQEKSQGLAVQAVTGDLDDIHDYTIASTEAKVTLELTAAIRNKAVDAFNEIMRMQA
ncbi:flagellar hook-basal body complex protein FliE [Jonesia denitrificans]|jgi:flagellar hook-basal body complex protein FliE|uniref:Flagellar hook-basal body complex protein FliE n=1 Tax=Jonesia denitrificans (strain ATCC 14870 / DSM 20603 / BCRC 15368 / CIP 55.134 / JCM 11481 / NBRC 15587 / NCTC 10816 / Prevot 55134) TaxID=471856 RepID=C7R0K2_JONDD|nr:flagellar hook-basal body complex protein FliE [Jonesia denitrificans]ACV09666.1 flagellar hook-basal body complex subunit FliE [Jonesia denitrificans DSM 20603]ASE09116.1 flagellar hook-basal body complex protein FliE [Jonesia denitrificans]QXB43660.1 flagellar hook-basal body complex protein FliE [Jonesia denitrificans]SQH22184.1 flagellar hook-basal body protein FliE [Jonesia denitrificans]